jgi:hypothetical protein
MDGVWWFKQDTRFLHSLLDFPSYMSLARDLEYPGPLCHLFTSCPCLSREELEQATYFFLHDGLDGMELGRD